jgi:hypothetical protein
LAWFRHACSRVAGSCCVLCCAVLRLQLRLILSLPTLRALTPSLTCHRL